MKVKSELDVEQMWERKKLKYEACVSCERKKGGKENKNMQMVRKAGRKEKNEKADKYQERMKLK